MTVMTNIQFADKLIDVAKNYKTLYVMGCFGAPMNASNKNRYCKNHAYNRQSERTAMIQAASNDTFGFDCVCLIKGILWGWSGDKNKTYGGAVYKANGVPDMGADSMIAKCSGISTNFENIEIGEAVWMKGHIGVYVGDGLAVECTPIWDNKVQITACNCNKDGYNRRNWTKHGKLPYINYVAAPVEEKKKTTEEIAKEVFAGKWGNGTARKNALIKAGYNYSEVQAKVNELSAAKKNTVTVTVTPTVEENYQCIHIVVKGDTLWGLATKYLSRGARYKEIKTLNDLKTNTLSVGQKLKIPKK